MQDVSWRLMTYVGIVLVGVLGHVVALQPPHEHPRDQEILRIKECPR
jgi:hypothetical protein